jgi:hypothetical protein
LILSNGPEVLVFKKVNTDKYLKYMLDEFAECESSSCEVDDSKSTKTLIGEKELRIFPQYFEDGEFIRDKNYHAKFYYKEFGCRVINEFGKEVFVHNAFIYKAK